MLVDVLARKLTSKALFKKGCIQLLVLKSARKSPVLKQAFCHRDHYVWSRVGDLVPALRQKMCSRFADQILISKILPIPAVGCSCL